MNDANESLQTRIYGKPSALTLIYLPGIHGDWTLVRGFREALKERVRFVEVTYPRTLEWSLADYAAEIERVLAGQGIVNGWLLGESFGSQVLWAMLERSQFKVEGIVLAGGFIRYPMPWATGVAKSLFERVPLGWVREAMRGYATIARFRYRNSQGTLESITEFTARRTELDRQAIAHRMRLIRENDPRAIARRTRVPVFALAGLIDPVVPWIGVKPWLRKHCPGFRASRVVWNADHNVLGTAPEVAVEQVLRWMASAQEDCP